MALRNNGTRAPEASAAGAGWRGLGVRIRGHDVVVPLEEVVELADAGTVTPIPGSKSWIAGVTNVRGNVITVVDLDEYLGARQVGGRETTQVLVLRIFEGSCGLLVNFTHGLRQFSSAPQSSPTRPDELPEDVFPSFADRDGEKWWLLDTGRLAQREDFKDGSLQ